MIHEVDERELVIDYTTFVHQVLNALPKEYETMVKIIREKLKNEGKNAVDISYLSSDFSRKYEKLVSSEEFKKRGKDEVAFVGFNNHFKGKCHFCGKIGHKAIDCQDRKKKNKKDNNKRGYKKASVPQCYNCKEMGHKHPDCPKLKKNEEEGAFLPRKLM